MLFDDLESVPYPLSRWREFGVDNCFCAAQYVEMVTRREQIMDIRQIRYITVIVKNDGVHSIGRYVALPPININDCSILKFCKTVLSNRAWRRNHKIQKNDATLIPLIVVANPHKQPIAAVPDGSRLGFYYSSKNGKRYRLFYLQAFSLVKKRWLLSTNTIGASEDPFNSRLLADCGGAGPTTDQRKKRNGKNLRAGSILQRR